MPHARHSQQFETALAFLLGVEGGYVNHPRDPGGATNLGITQRTLDDYRRRHVDWGLPASVRQLTHAHAARIYHAGYWAPVRGDELPLGVSLIVFDGAVNHGPSRATRWLQQAAGAAADGIIGPKTLAAVRRAAPDLLIGEVGALRAVGYEATGDWDAFGLGWMRRLMAVVQASTTLARA